MTNLQVYCEFCHGDMFNLGKLGSAQWFRCRDCGRERHLDESELERFKAFCEVANECADED